MRKFKFYIGTTFGLLAGGAILWLALGVIERAYQQQHPVVVTIGLFAGLLSVIIHEWRTIE